MGEKYIGKICPYCKTPMAEGEQIVFCSVCEMPHHLSCWQDNQGCTTFGCTGTIKEVIGGDTKTLVKEIVQQTEKPIETLYESKEVIFMKGAPILLENAALIMDRAKDKLFARCTFRCLAEVPIQAVMVEITCQDVWGSTLGEPVVFQYLDLKTSRETKFGQTSPVELADKTTRKIQATVKKVLFADGTVVTCEGSAQTMPAPVLLQEHLGSQELAEEFARETTSKAQYLPANVEGYWFCTCGAWNLAEEETCHNCGFTQAQLTAALDPKQLQENLLGYVEEKRAAEEKAKAEQEARIKRAEEEVRAEKKKRDAELLAAENAAKKKKRRKRTLLAILIPLISLIAAGCLTLFVIWPLAIMHQGDVLLEAGKYDEAYDKYVSLNGYGDSTDRANEAVYRKAQACLENGEYYVAIKLFQNLGNYANAPKMVKKATYQWAQAALNDGYYTKAISLFKELGDYEDSAEMVKESQYQYANSLQEDEEYKEAYKLYVELGTYKNSKEEVDTTILLWTAAALGSEDRLLAKEFKANVDLNYEQYALVYNTILLFVYGHEDVDYWCYGSGDFKVPAENTSILLEMLPASYEETGLLQELFAMILFNEGVWYWFSDDEDLMRRCWSIPFIQDAATQDVVIYEFLKGYWSGSGYYLKFYENDDGGTRSTFDLPWVSKPYGTKYYDIDNMIYYWNDADHNHLTEVFKFTIIDYDILEVYCYRNGRTYTLYR